MEDFVEYECDSGELNLINSDEIDLQDEFKCCSCEQYVCPPFLTCKDSEHMYCPRCFIHIINCLLCNCQVVIKKDFRLKQIHDELVFPCKFMKFGCNIRSKGSYLKSHQESCVKLKIVCPLAFYGCTWIGSRNEIIEHFIEVHPLDNYQIRGYLKKEYHFVMDEQSNTLFILKIDSWERANWKKWTLLYVGNEDDAKKYCYWMIFFDKNNCRVADFHKKCLSLVGDTTILGPRIHQWVVYRSSVEMENDSGKFILQIHQSFTRKLFISVEINY